MHTLEERVAVQDAFLLLHGMFEGANFNLGTFPEWAWTDDFADRYAARFGMDNFLVFIDDIPEEFITRKMIDDDNYRGISRLELIPRRLRTVKDYDHFLDIPETEEKFVTREFCVRAVTRANANILHVPDKYLLPCAAFDIALIHKTEGGRYESLSKMARYLVMKHAAAFIAWPV